MPDIWGKINHLPTSRLILCLMFTAALITCKKDKDEEEEEIKTKETEYCEDSCIFANDGECDDGGQDSQSDYCDWGTDCTDCGKRIKVEIVK